MFHLGVEALSPKRRRKESLHEMSENMLWISQAEMIRHSSQEDVNTREGGALGRRSASVIKGCHSLWEDSMSQTR